MARRLITAVHVTNDRGERNVFLPGANVPQWAQDKITNPDVWADTADEDDEEPLGYVDMTVTELRALIEGRNTSRDEENHLSKSGNKAELIERLTEDDHTAEAEAQPAVDTTATAYDPVAGPPAKAGKGSSKELWVAYAAHHQVEHDAGATREQIVDALDAVGVPV